MSRTTSTLAPGGSRSSSRQHSTPRRRASRYSPGSRNPKRAVPHQSGLVQQQHPARGHKVSWSHGDGRHTRTRTPQRVYLGMAQKF